MTKQILMITSSFDKTCDYLISKYKNIDFFRFNLDNFSSYQITISADGFEIKNSYRKITSFSCLSIYFRKPVNENLNNVFDSKYHNFAFRESYSLIEGIVESFVGKCLSKPSDIRKSGNKIYQSFLAKQVGFKIPSFLITNDKNKIQDISSEPLIVKPISIGLVQDEQTKEFVQTNIYDENCDLKALKYSPAYFQHFIDKDFEVRITFIDKKAFPVKISSKNNIDWRKSKNEVTYSKHIVPIEIYNKCLLFLEKSNMRFGCFDFIIKNNIWYFLEMNSNGQWAWLEFETELPISQAIIDYLND